MRWCLNDGRRVRIPRVGDIGISSCWALCDIRERRRKEVQMDLVARLMLEKPVSYCVCTFCHWLGWGWPEKAISFMTLGVALFGASEATLVVLAAELETPCLVNDFEEAAKEFGEVALDVG